MSAEVPKLHHRFPLGESTFAGDRPPTEVVVLLTDPALLRPLPLTALVDAPPTFDERAMAFPALSRFEYV